VKPSDQQMIAITRQPAANLANGERTHLSRTAIDFALAQQQHAQYCDTLRQTGVEVITLPALEGYPDSVFVEDVLIVLPEIAVLCNPGAASRQVEVDAMASDLKSVPLDRPVERINTLATLDGGDVLRVGRTLFVGLSTRTNAAGIEQLRELTISQGYDVIPVRVKGALHLKTAVTAIANDVVLMNPDWIDEASQHAFAAFKHIHIAPPEPFAANALRIAQTLLVAQASPETADRITRAGFDCTAIDISEFGKAEAGLTCMSILIS
jgi:dimethylargininase